MEKRVEEVVVARVEHGVHHGTSDTQHGGAAVLDLNIEGTVTLFDIKDLVLARVSTGDTSGSTVVTSRKVLGTSSVLVGRGGVELDDTGGEEDLGNSKRRNVGKCGETHTVLQDGVKVVLTIQGKATGEGDAGFLEDHTNKGSHGNTAVLDFNGTSAGEGIQVLGQAEGVEKVERTGVDTQTIRRTRVSVQGSADTGFLWKGKVKEYDG